MRSFEAISADARDGSPFSNGTSGEIWMSKWCYQCKVDGPFQRGVTDQGCPLLLIAYCGQTPAEWTETGLQDYHCSEFVPEDGGADGDPDPDPQPMPGQTDMFEVFADQITDAVTEREAVPA